jgi:hypothetical protein
MAIVELQSDLARLALDAERFRELERIAAYEIANALLLTSLDLQTRVGLRAEPYQVFMLIVIATVQRYARATDQDERYLTRTPLPTVLSGAISRRRIAEVLGIPLETVRRHVAGLLSHGLIVERSRGKLSTPGGTLERIGGDATPEKIAKQIVSLANLLIRKEIVRVERR